MDKEQLEMRFFFLLLNVCRAAQQKQEEGLCREIFRYVFVEKAITLSFVNGE